MAQTIKLKRNASAGTSVPSTSLALGEPAVNTTTAKLYLKDDGNVIVDISASIIDVTVSDSKYLFNTITPSDMSLQKGQTYLFRQTDSSNVGHKLIFTEGEAHNSTEYITGVTHQTDSGNTIATEIKIPFNAPDLYINCANNANMGIPVIFGGGTPDDVLRDGDFTENGLMKRTGAGTYTVDTSTYLTSETHAQAGYLTSIPALALTDVQVKSSEVEQLQLTVEEGDICVRTDLTKTYVALNDTNGAMSDWQELLNTGSVHTVNGQTGTVTISNVSTVADQADLLAISSPIQGDLVVVTGEGTYVHNGGEADTIADWTSLSASVDFSAVDQDIIPDADGTRDLGSASKKWKELYLTSDSLHLGDSSLSISGAGDLQVGVTEDVDGTPTAVTKKVASYDSSGNIEITGTMTVSGDVRGGNVVNSGFLGTTTTTKEINYVHYEPSSTGDHATLDTGLISYYKMEDDWTDSKGSNDGTAVGAVFGDGTKGGGTKAGSFDGTDDYVDLGNVSYWDIFKGTNENSVSFWVKYDDVTVINNDIMGQSNGGSINPKWNIMINFGGTIGKINYYYFDTALNDRQLLWNFDAVNDTWYHYVFVKNSTDITLYIDGVSQGSEVLAGGGPSTSINSGLRLGTDGEGWEKFGGSLDELGIWNRALTGEEVTSLYRNGDGATYTSASNKFFTSIPAGTSTGTQTLTVPTGSVSYLAGNVGIGTDTPVSTLDVAGAVQQHSKYSSEDDMVKKVDAANRAGTTGVIGNDLHYVDASGNLQETMRVDTDTADASDYTGFNITTNITQTQQTGWGETGNTVQTGTSIDQEAVPASGDPHWDNTVLLIQSTDSDSGSIFSDTSESGHSISTVGGSHSTTQEKFGTSSIDLTGTTSLKVANSDDFTLDGDFTIECWTYKTTNVNYSQLFGGANNGTGNNASYWVEWSDQRGIWFVEGTTQKGAILLINPAPILHDSTWHHIAFVRTGGTLSAYLDGKFIGSNSNSEASNTLYKGTLSHFYIGDQPAVMPAWNGYIEEFRITKGVGRYSGTNTDEWSNFLDDGTTAWTQPTEAFGIGEYVEASDAIPGGPIYSFVPDGNIYYDDGNVGIGTTAPNYQLDVGGNINASGEILQNGQALMTRDDVPKQYWLPYDETFGTGDATTGDDHYNDVSLLMHMNGADGSSVFDDHSRFNHTVAQAGVAVDGVQPKVKLDTGANAYTVEGTPASGDEHLSSVTFHLTGLEGSSFPVSSTVGTSVLTNGGGDATTVSDDTFTTVWEFGNNDFVLLDNASNFTLGNSDFTLDAWVNVPAYDESSGHTLLGIHDEFGDVRVDFRLNMKGRIQFYTNSAGINESITNTDTSHINVADGTWRHIAYERSGNTISMYVDGVLDHTVDCSSFNHGAPGGNAVLGRLSNQTAWYFNGKVADIRFTQGVARFGGEFSTASWITTPTRFETGTYVAEVPAVNTPANLSKYGNAMGDFTTDGAYLAVADHGSFNLGIGDFTAEAWVKPVEVNKTTTVLQDLTIGDGGTPDNYTIDNIDYVSHTFTSDGTFTTSEDLIVDIMLVGGGGGGGHYAGGAGGGAGGMLVVTNQTLTAGTTYAVDIGAGGSAGGGFGSPPGGGEQSSFGDFIAYGGSGAGYGSDPGDGPHLWDGDSGTWGSVGGDVSSGTVPTAGQGNVGGGEGGTANGQGGGGAGAAGVAGGSTGGAGGDGLQNNFRDGTDKWYAGGGGGGGHGTSYNATGQAGGAGGQGGGGTGGDSGTTGQSESGTPNTGGGGAGAAGLHGVHGDNSSGAGGSGIVVLRFAESASSTVLAPGGGGVFQLGSDSLKMDVYDSKIRVSNNTTALVTGTTNLTSDAWNHVAVSRNEGNLRTYLNGTQEGSTVANSIHDFNSNNLLNVGRIENAESYVNPSTGEQYPTETKLLLQDEANSFTNAVAGSSTSVNLYGGLAMENNSSNAKFGDWSIYANNNDAYANVAGSSDWAFSNGDFTVEMWVNFESLNTSDGIWKGFMSLSDHNQTTLGWQFGLNPTGTLIFSWNGGTSGNDVTYDWSTAGTVPQQTTGQWYHVAASRTGSDISIFIDGKIVGTNSSNPIIGDPGGYLQPNRTYQSGSGGYALGNGTLHRGIVGRYEQIRITKGAGRYTADFDLPTAPFGFDTYVAGSSGITLTDSFWTGYMDEFRLTKGTGRYSNTFSVPTQEFGNQKPVVIGDYHYDNVSLSAHMAGIDGEQDFVDSSSNKHTISAVGDVYTKEYTPAITGNLETIVNPDKDQYWDNITALLNGDYNNGRNSIQGGEVPDLINVSINEASSRWTSGNGYGFSLTSYLDIGSTTGFESGSWTKDAWVSFTNVITENQTVFSTAPDYSMSLCYNHGTGTKLRLQIASAAGSWDVADSSGTKENWVDNTWYHIALVYDGTTYKVYVDGIEDISVTGSAQRTPTIHRFGAAGDANNYRFDGKMDDIRVTKGVARTFVTKPTEELAVPSIVSQTYTDPHWDDIVLLIHSDHQDTTNVFVDSSPANQIVTPNYTGGQASNHIHHATSDSKFGGSSIYFDGSHDAIYVTDPDDGSSDFVFDGEFTMECFFKMHAGIQSGRRYCIFGSKTHDASTDSFQSWIYYSSYSTPKLRHYFRVYDDDQGNEIPQQQSLNVLLETDRWYHYAITRDANSKFCIWVDGMLAGSFVSDITFNSANTFQIGTLSSSTDEWKGWIDEIRVTKGVARYTEPFHNSLPASPFGETYEIGITENSTIPLASDSSLFTFDLQSEDDSFQTNGTGNATIAPGVNALAGTGIATSPSSEHGLYSYYGSTAAVDTQYTSNPFQHFEISGLDSESGDYTLEFWYYDFDEDISYAYIFDARKASYGNNGYAPALTRYQDHGFRFYTAYNSGTIVQNLDIPYETWHHIAVQHNSSSGEMTYFLNGARLITFTNQSGRDIHPSGTVQFLKQASTASNQYRNHAYITDIRFTKSMLYTNDMFIPEDRLTTNFIDKQKSSWNIDSMVGATDTYNPKFGTAAAVFDGTGDKLTVSSDDSFTFTANEDYTIEGWIKTEQVGLVDAYPSIITTGTTSLEIGLNGYVAGCESVDGTKNYITSNVTVNDDKWHHVAISRNTGITRLFVDGVLQTETRTSIEAFTNSGVTIGSDASNNDYSGSMDDIRITKGVGRYTENFSRPAIANGDVKQVGDFTPVNDDIYYTSGKVGFGNDNPEYQVDVTGSVNTTGGFYESGAKVETFKRSDTGHAQYAGKVEVTEELQVDSWTIKEENGNLILVKSDGTKWEIGLTEITE